MIKFSLNKILISPPHLASKKAGVVKIKILPKKLRRQRIEATTIIFSAHPLTPTAVRVTLPTRNL
jgi:hypothetical protein